MRDRNEVETMYMNDGYLQVDIGEPEIDATEEGLSIRLKIKEGPQFHVGTIDVAGDSTMDLSALREKVRLDDGDVFNRSYLTQDVEVLEQHYTDRGFFLASVRPQTRLYQESLTVDVEFVGREGAALLRSQCEYFREYENDRSSNPTRDEGGRGSALFGPWHSAEFPRVSDVWDFLKTWLLSPSPRTILRSSIWT